ncbi:hypothetical protein H8957_016871, partial [Semnopithecus entellus]
SGPAPGAVLRPLRRGGPLRIRVPSGKRLAGLTDDTSPWMTLVVPHQPEPLFFLQHLDLHS